MNCTGKDVVRIFGRWFTSFHVDYSSPFLGPVAIQSTVMRPPGYICYESWRQNSIIFRKHVPKVGGCRELCLHRKKLVSTLFQVAAQYETMPELANNVTSFRRTSSSHINTSALCTHPLCCVTMGLQREQFPCGLSQYKTLRFIIITFSYVCYYYY